jgi:hypothetical protein
VKKVEPLTKISAPYVDHSQTIHGHFHTIKKKKKKNYKNLENMQCSNAANFINTKPQTKEKTNTHTK